MSSSHSSIVSPSPRLSTAANADGSAMPPVRKIRMPSSTDRSGKSACARGKHHHVAQIQVIGRHVHRHQRFRPAPRSSVNSRVRNPSTRPAPRVLDEHDLLEARFVVGRERRHQLLHRRVDRLEHRHVQQPASRPAAAPAGRSRWWRPRPASRMNAAVISTPSPGTSRPSSAASTAASPRRRRTGTSRPAPPR